jgi:hypothetical protein
MADLTKRKPKRFRAVQDGIEFEINGEEMVAWVADFTEGSEVLVVTPVRRNKPMTVMPRSGMILVSV